MVDNSEAYGPQKYHHQVWVHRTWPMSFQKVHNKWANIEIRQLRLQRKITVRPRNEPPKLTEADAYPKYLRQVIIFENTLEPFLLKGPFETKRPWKTI